MRIVVFGGSGFIGSHLVDALLRGGHEVTVFDRAPSPRHDAMRTCGDVRDADAVRAVSRGAELLVDLAAEHRDDVQPPQRYFEVNLGGARNIAAAAAAHGITRVLFTSSAAVYGYAARDVREDAATVPEGDYGRSKLAAEAAYRAWQREDGSRRSLTIVRPAAVFGAGSHGNLRRLMQQLHRHRFVFAGDGSNRKSIAYVGNLVEFLCARIMAAAGEHCFNFADAPDRTTAELVHEIQAVLPTPQRVVPRIPFALALLAARIGERVARAAGREPGVTARRVRAFRAETTLSTEALQREGFQPRYGLREALASTLPVLDETDPRD